MQTKQKKQSNNDPIKFCTVAENSVLVYTIVEDKETKEVDDLMANTKSFYWSE